MAQFAALLRGVNVGPTTKVPMAELRAVLEEELGATDVKTLLNSGNVVFHLHASPKSVADDVSKVISKKFGFEIDVVCRTKKQLESVLAHDPIKAADDDSKYLVLFMPEPPNKSKVKQVVEAEYPAGEQCALRGREFWIWSPNGISKSKSAEALARSKAAPFTTGRNVRTIRKLIDLF